jgi:holliday junction DNA helicase RuvA
MIEYICGQLKEKNPATVIIEINGIAYKLFIPLSTYEKLPENGSVLLFTSLVIHGGISSSNELRIYGFSSKEERQFFQFLCSVTRVGPLLALRILSGSSISNIKKAIISEDIKVLSKIKGVGVKTAQRIIMELKDSFKDFEITTPDTEEVTLIKNTAVTEAVLVLIALGYNRNIAEKTVKNILQKQLPEISTEIIVKQALKESQYE